MRSEKNKIQDRINLFKSFVDINVQTNDDFIRWDLTKHIWKLSVQKTK